jgi:putative acetyltransferase
MERSVPVYPEDFLCYLFPMKSITPVLKSEYEAVTDLWERSVRATHHFLTEENIRYFRPLILNNYLDAVELGCIRDHAGRIEAFMGISDGKLEMLFVEPELRGSGLGKMLVQHAVNKLGVTKVDVNEANEQAVAFYKKMGFVQTGYSELDGSGKPFPLIHMEIVAE